MESSTNSTAEPSPAAWTCAGGAPNWTPPARTADCAEALVPLAAFLDFVVTTGPERLKLAKPPGPCVYDFYAKLVDALRFAHELGRLDGLSADTWAEVEDVRRRRVYPICARAYAAAARKHEALYRRPTPRTLHLGPLDVLVEPHAVWGNDRGGRDTAIFLHFDCQAAGAKRTAVTLAAASLAGLHGGFVDIQHGADLITGTTNPMREGEARAFFEAEALSFMAMRRAGTR
jgi:hypothetical protein